MGAIKTTLIVLAATVSLWAIVEVFAYIVRCEIREALEEGSHTT